MWTTKSDDLCDRCWFLIQYTHCTMATVSGILRRIRRPVLLMTFVAVVFFIFILHRVDPLSFDRYSRNTTSILSANHVDDKPDKAKISGAKRKNFTADMIKPPDHLEAVKMERDGHLNKNFRKEILLGQSVRNNDDLKDEPNILLSKIFKKVDTDRDSLISEQELQKWIAAKVKEHFSQAVKDNFWIFSALDKNRDGRVSWEEYHVNYLVEQGFGEDYARNHPKDHKGLERKVKEKILLDKAAWSEAARSDPEALNIDEFLTFRHPEHSHVSLLNMVNDIISSLDTNGDELLTEEEFIQIPQDEKSRLSEKAWKRERTKEFREVIDTNHDGKVSRIELLTYNDPENPVHAQREARELIRLADSSKDGKLSLSEILAEKDLFLGSKMVDTAKSFHDEF